MADLSRTVEILFNGVDNVSDTLDTVSRNMGRLGQDIGDISAPFVTATEKIAEMNLAIAGIAGIALKARSDIETETTKMGNALGVPIEKVEEFADIAGRIYKDDFADTVSDAFDLVTSAASRFKAATSEDLGQIVKDSQKLASTFDIDYADAMSGASSLMNDFGLSSEQAFDFLAKGFQEGLNKSDDFIDSINEYGQLFADGGASADDMFRIFKGGFDESILGTDKVADLFKEFGVKISEGGKSVEDAFAALGIKYADVVSDLSTGKTTISDVFTTVTSKIAESEDGVTRFKNGVALMGTPFEDLGSTAVTELGKIKDTVADIDGAMAKLSPDESLGKKFTQLRKTITYELTSSDMWGLIDDKLQNAFGGMKTSFEEAFADADFSDLEDAFDNMLDAISDNFGDMDLDLTTVEGMKNAIDLVSDAIAGIVNTGAGLYDALSPVIQFAKDAVQWFGDLDPKTQNLIGKIAGLGTELAILGGILSTGSALFGGLSTLAGMFGSGSVLMTGLTSFGLLLAGPAGIAIGLGAVATAAMKFSFGNMAEDADLAMKALDKQNDVLNDLYDSIANLPDDVQTVDIYAAVDAGELEKAQTMIDKATADAHIAEIAAEVEAKEFHDFMDNMEDIPDETVAEITAAINEGDFARVQDLLAEAGEGVTTEVAVSVDETSVSDAKTTLEYFVDGERYTIEVDVEATNVEAAKDKIDEIPTEKQLEIKLQGDIDKEIESIKSTAETAQTAMEWTAKIDIAQAESAAEVLKSAFESSASVVGDLSDSTSDMFGSLLDGWNELSGYDKMQFMDLLEDQADMEKKAADAQIKLLEAQIKLMEEKSKAMQNGDGLIKIDSTGLEPALEMVMWEIISKVQVRAAEEASEFLLGV